MYIKGENMNDNEINELSLFQERTEMAEKENGRWTNNETKDLSINAGKIKQLNKMFVFFS